ncbi:PQQ-binding-like beta-propeller repeat protein [Methanococcoides seepicolus]|uniref:PQQ-binding-like beta-propeller repeat protein n=1 Tax=Methanococcoides seepicolus TaxID=2828780 RepID=A0A9E5DBP2_9EURY|nr:PQQ-binding-like beta-propeller repeat protein [Methanococcoides seepicolus]MCM1987057.1 PQQ-binding-like beta-propeller repeat protein [Methanococcoides seepicolus]
MRNNSKAISIGLFVLITIFASCTPVVASDWSTFLKDNSNTGITADEAPITAPEISVTWATKVGYANTAPMIVGNTIYVASKQNVLAIDKVTGDIIWQSDMHNLDIIGNPTYGNNKIFVPTSTGYLFTFNATTGAELWDISVGNTRYLLSPIKYEDNRIYFADSTDWGGSNGTFYCYDENGNQIWTYTSTSSGNIGYYFAGAALIDDYIVFGNSNGNLTSLYTINGTTVDEMDIKTIWGDYDACFMRSSISYSEDNGRLYFTSTESGMTATKGYCFAVGFDPSTGTFNTSDKARAYIGATTSTPVIFNNRVYVGNATTWGSATGTVFCLDGTNLSKIWTFTPEGDAKFQSSAAISTRYVDTDGSVYIYFTSNTADGSLYCLKDYEGNTNPIHRYTYVPSSTMQQFTLGSPIISDGRVYYTNNEVTGNGGYLFSLATAESLDPDTLDWNPWNDPDSEGLPDGTYITLTEVIDAYNCFRNGTPAPETGASINLTKVIDMYNAFRNGTPM